MQLIAITKRSKICWKNVCIQLALAVQVIMQLSESRGQPFYLEYLTRMRLHMPNLFNGLSLIVDLMLVRFWKRNVQPHSNIQNLTSISGGLVPGDNQD